MSTPQAKRAGRIFWTMCGLVLCGLLAWLLTPRETSLWKRARLLEPREDFLEPGFFSHGNMGADWPYCWLTPHTFLTVHFHKTDSFQTPGFRYEWRLTDIDDRRPPVSSLVTWLEHHPLPVGIGFRTRSVNSPVVSMLNIDLCFQASPDGRWMLCPIMPALASSGRPGKKPSTPLCFAVTADGSRAVTWMFPEGVRSSIWLRDNRRWMALGEDHTPEGTLSLVDLAVPEVAQPMALHLPANAVLLGATSDGQAIASDWQQVTEGNITAEQFQPDPETLQMRTFSLPVPGDRAAVPFVSPILSPKGDRIAWFVRIPRTPPGGPRFQRFWALWKIFPHTDIGLWTTRLDGSDSQEIGRYRSADEIDLPSALQWTPDSRRLSFRYQGALYSVSANN